MLLAYIVQQDCSVVKYQIKTQIPLLSAVLLRLDLRNSVEKRTSLWYNIKKIVLKKDCADIAVEQLFLVNENYSLT